MYDMPVQFSIRNIRCIIFYSLFLFLWFCQCFQFFFTLYILPCLVDKSIQNCRVGSGYYIPALIHRIRLDRLCPLLIFRGNPLLLPPVHDCVCKHIADTVNAVFLYDIFRCPFGEAVSVKIFSDSPVNGILAGNLCVTLHLFLCLFKRFLRLFLFIFRIGFFPFWG